MGVGASAPPGARGGAERPERRGEALVREDSCTVLCDPHRLVRPVVVDIARAALRLGLGPVSLMCRCGPSGALAVRVGEAGCAEGVRELTVRDAPIPWGLTPRQLEVLTLLSFGLTNQEIGAGLGIRLKTVGAHVEDLFTRLGVTNRTLATVVAVEHGLRLMDVVPGDDELPGLDICRLRSQWDRQRRGAEPAGGRERTAPGRGVPPRARDRPWGRTPLRIGSIIPQQLPGEALDMLQGAELAIRSRNARGGAHGTPIEHLVVSCDVFDSASMTEALARLRGMGVDAVLLGYNLDYPNTERFLRAAGETEVPVIHASTSRLAIDNVADNPGLLGNIFHICAGDELYGPGILSLLDHVEAAHGVGLRGRRLALIEPPPGMDVLGPYTADRLCDRGIGLLAVGRGQSLCDAAERSHIVAELDRLDPDIVVCASFLDEQLLVDVLTSFTGEARRPLVFSLFTPSLAGFVEDNAALVEGLVWSTQTGTYHDALGQRFRREMMSSYGRWPGHSQAGVHFDAVSMLVRSWLDAGHPRDYADVTRRMREHPYRGVNGSYWLAGAGQAPLSYPYESLDGSLAQAQLIYQVRGGRNAVILPDAYAEAGVSIKGTRLAGPSGA